jgi:hypothetical protein
VHGRPADKSGDLKEQRGRWDRDLHPDWNGHDRKYFAPGLNIAPMSSGDEFGWQLCAGGQNGTGKASALGNREPAWAIEALARRGPRGGTCRGEVLLTAPAYGFAPGDAVVSIEMRHGGGTAFGPMFTAEIDTAARRVREQFQAEERMQSCLGLRRSFKSAREATSNS